MNSKLFFLIFGALYGFCNSAFVDTLIKCSSKDKKCLGDLIQSIIKEVGDNGIPEMDTPKMDPLKLTNLPIPTIDFLDVILEEGDVKGIKTCVVDRIEVILDKGITNADIICDFTVNAKFKVNGSTPFAKDLFGQEAINGIGNAVLKIDKLQMKMQFFYDVIEKNGDIYLNYHKDDLKSDFQIESLKVSDSKIFLGEQDVSELVENFFNQNWQLIVSTFGRSVYNVALNILSNILMNLFDKIPVKQFFTDDVASLVKN